MVVTGPAPGSPGAASRFPAGLSNVGLALTRVSRKGLLDQRKPGLMRARTRSASWRIVNSWGLPKLIGPVEDPFINRIKPSTDHRHRRTALAAVAVKGDRLTAQGLHDEIAHHTTIVGQHARAVGVEDAGDADLAAMHALVIEAGFQRCACPRRNRRECRSDSRNRDSSQAGGAHPGRHRPH